MIRIRRTSAALVVIATCAVLVPASVASASTVIPHSVGGNCSAGVDTHALRFQPDEYRVHVSCSSLNPNSKARGTLDFPLSVDEHTQWFTQLNVVYTTDYYSSPSEPTARPEFGSV
jgi:hypothetical protein